MAKFTEAVVFAGKATFGGQVSGLDYTKLAQRELAVYNVSLLDWRVWNAVGTNLPAAAAADDLGLYGGTFGTDAFHISTGDVKNIASTLMYARGIIQVPAEYVDGETFTLRFYAGCKTTVASVSATLDVEAFLADEGLVDGSDLYTGAAQSINSLVFANKDFNLTPTNITAGAFLDVRIAIAANDSATATAVDPSIGFIQKLCDTRG